jgi:hypothetical protein
MADTNINNDGTVNGNPPVGNTNGTTPKDTIPAQQPITNVGYELTRLVGEQEANRQQGINKATLVSRDNISKIKKENRANGVYGDTDVSIYSFILSGYTDPAEISTIANNNGFNLTLDTEVIENGTLTEEQKQTVYRYGSDIFRQITNGDVQIGDDKILDNPFQRMIYKNEGIDERKFVNVKNIKITQEGEVDLGNGVDIELYHVDEYSSSLGAGIDLKGNLVPLSKLQQSDNRLMREAIYDPLTEATYHVWREVKPSEFVPEGSIRTIFGDRSVESGTWVGSLGRGALSYAGSFVGGIGWTAGLFGATEFENKTYQFKGAVTHMNRDEEMGAFDNINSFLFQTGNTLAQTLGTVALAYAGGGALSLASNSQKVISLGSRILSTTTLSAAQAGDMYSQCISEGVDPSVARKGSVAMGAMLGLTEQLGWNMLIDPMKNRYVTKKAGESLASVLTSKYVKDAGEVTTKKGIAKTFSKLSQSVGKMSSSLDKTAVGRGFATVLEEVPEELIQDIATNNMIYPLTNYMAKNAADEKKRMIDGSKVALSVDGRLIGYTYINGSGQPSFITAEEYGKNDDIVANGGVYAESDMDTWGHAWETVVMTTIGSFPAGSVSFYGSNHGEFDYKSMYDMAYGVATGKLQEKDLLDGLYELHKANRLLQLSVKEGPDGKFVTQDREGSFDYYKKSFLTELNTLVSVIKDNNLNSAATLESMSDANGMNRFVLHGALGAALRIKEYTDALNNLSSGVPVVDGKFVKSTMSSEEISSELEKAKKDYDYFSMPSGKEVEIGSIKLSAKQSQAVNDYYLHNSLIPQMVLLNMRDEYRKEAITKGIKEEKDIKEYANKKLVEAIVSSKLNSNIEQLLSDMQGDDKNVLKTFRDERDGIEEIRNVKEAELLELKRTQINSATENKGKIGSLVEQVKKAKEVVDKRLQILNDINGISEEVNKQSKLLETASQEKADVDKYLQQLEEQKAAYDEKIATAEEGTIALTDEERTIYEQLDSEINNVRKRIQENPIDEQIGSIQATINELNGKKQQREDELSKLPKSKSVGNELRKAAKGIAGFAFTEQMDELDSLMDELSEYYEGPLSMVDMDITSSLNDAFDMVSGNLREVKATDYVIGENQEITPVITEDEKMKIFGNSIIEKFFSQEQIALSNRIIRTLQDNQDLSLSDSEKQVFEEMTKSFSRAKLYLFKNIGFFQKNIEDNEKNREYTELNNRTRIADDVANNISEQLGAVQLSIELARASDKSLDAIKRNLHFHVKAMHMNMSYISVDALSTCEEYSEIALNDEELKDAADAFVYGITRMLDEHNAKYKTSYRSIVDLQKNFKTVSEEERAAMEQILLDAEKLLVQFADKFYSVNHANINTVTRNDGSVVSKGILQQLNEKMMELANQGNPFGLNNSKGYFNLKPDAIGNTDEHANVVKVVTDQETYYVDGATGQKISASNELIAIYFLNMIHSMGSVEYGKVYKELENIIAQNSDSSIVPTVEQQYVILQLVAHMANPVNYNYTSKHTDVVERKYVMDKLMYLKGAASAGKTSVIFKNALNLYNRLNNVSTKPRVLVISPTMETSKLMINSIADLAEVETSTYLEITNGDKKIEDKYDYVVLDESTILENDDVAAIKKNLNGMKAVIIALGDEFQTRNEDSGIVVPISYGGKNSIRIYEQHRSKISTIRDLQESLVSSILKGSSVILPTLQYTEYNGKTYGGRYYQTIEEVEKAFLDDTSNDSILVVETEEEANRLREKFGSKRIYSTEFNINAKESCCVSGIAAKRVYVAISTQKLDNPFSRHANKILTAATRAVEYVCLVGNGKSSSVSILSGLKEYMDAQANGESHAKEKEEAIKRIEYITNDNKQAGENIVEEKVEKNNTNAQEGKTGTGTEEEVTRETVVKESRYISRMVDNTTKGFNRVKENVNQAIRSFSEPNTETDGSIDDYRIVGDAITNKEVTMSSVHRKLVKKIIKTIHMALSKYSNDMVALEDYVAGIYLDYLDALTDEERAYELDDPSSVFRALMKSEVFMNFINDNQRVFGQQFVTIINHDGIVKKLTANMFGYRLIGEVNGKPVINPTVMELHSNVDVINEVRSLFIQLTNGTAEGYKAFSEALKRDDHVGHSLNVILRQMALNQVMVANRAVIAQHELIMAQSFINRNGMGFISPIAIDAVVLKPFIDNILNNDLKVSVVGNEEQELSEQGPFYGDRIIPLDDVIKEEEKLRSKRPGSNIELRNGRVVVYTGKDGLTHVSFIDYPFMRYEDGKPHLMLYLDNNEEVDIEMVQETKLSGKVDHVLNTLSNGMKYLSSYYMPEGLSRDEGKTLSRARRKILKHLTTKNDIMLERKYKKSERLVFVQNGKEVVDDVEHLVYYKLRVSDIEAMRGTVLTDEEADIFQKHNVIGVEGIGVVAGRYSGESEIGIFDRYKLKQHPIIKEELGKYKINALSDERIKNIADTIRQRLIDNHYNEVYVNDAVEQLVYILKNINGRGEQQLVKFHNVEKAAFHKTERSVEDNDYDSMMSLNAFSAQLKEENELGEFVLDTTRVNFNFPSDEDVRKADSKRIQSGAKPEFTMMVKSVDDNRIIPVRVVSPKIKNVDTKELADLMISNIKELVENEPDAGLERLIDTLIGQFKDVNNVFIRNVIGNKPNAKQLFDKFFYVYKSKKNGKYYVRMNRSLGSNLEELSTSLSAMRDDLVSMLEAFSEAYIPITAYNSGSETIKEYLGDKIKVQVGMAENGLFASPGFIVSMPINNDESIGMRNGMNTGIEDTDDMDIHDILHPKKLSGNEDNLDLVSYEEAKEMLVNMLGEEYVSKYFMGLEEGLQNPLTREAVLGFVHRGKMKLRSLNGEVDKRTVIHEAAHVVYEYMVDENTRQKIAREIKNEYGQNADVSEKIAELAEEYTKPKSTILKKFVEAVKHFLNRIGIYAFDVNDFVEALVSGYYAGMNLKGTDSEDVFAKELRYGSIEPLIDTFGSIAEASAYIKRVVRPILRNNLFVNGYVDRGGEETLESAIKGTFTKLYYPTVVSSYIAKQNEIAKRTGVKPELPVYCNMKPAEIGETKRIINGLSKSVKEIGRNDIRYLRESSDPYDDETLEMFTAYKLSDSNVVKSIIQQAVGDIDISRILSPRTSRNARKSELGNKTSGVIRNDNTAEVTDLFKTISPFIKLILGTTRYYSDISYDANTNMLIINDKSENGYVSTTVAHKILIDAAKIANQTDPNGEDMVGALLHALADVAQAHKGMYRTTALSILAEYGDAKKHYKGLTEQKKILMGKVYHKGYLGMIRDNDEEIVMSYGANRLDLIRRKGTRIMTEFLIPMSNLYRSLEARNTIDVEYGDGKVYIRKNDRTSENPVRNRIRETLKSKLYDGEGFVDQATIDKIFANVTINSNGLFIADGDATRRIVSYENGTFKFDFTNENLKGDIIKLFKIIGITINARSSKALADEINVDYRLGKVTFKTINNLPAHLLGMVLSLKVNMAQGKYAKRMNELMDIIDNPTDDYSISDVEKARMDMMELKKKYEDGEFNVYSLHDKNSPNAVSDAQILNDIYGLLGYKQEAFVDGISREATGMYENVSPRIWDMYLLMNELSDIIANANGEGKATTFRNKENKIIQSYIIGNQLTRLFARGGKRLKALFDKIAKQGSNIMTNGKNIFSILSDKAAALFGNAISIEIAGLYDVENYVSKNSILHYNKTPFADRMYAHITDGFVNRLLNGENNDGTVSIIASPNSDRHNNKVIEAKLNGMVQMKYDKASKTVEATINKKMVVDSILNNIEYVKSIQAKSIENFSRVIDKFASVIGITFEYEKTPSGIKSAVDTLSNQYGELFSDYVKNRLIEKRDYFEKDGRISVGNAINLNHPHNPYSQAFIDEFDKLKSKAGSKSIYNEAYDLVKKHFLDNYKQFASFLIDNNYKVPLSYIRSFNQEKVENYNKDIVGIIESHKELVSAKLEEFKKQKENDAYAILTESQDNAEMMLRALGNAIISINEKKKISDFNGYVQEDGDYTEEGAIAAGYVREFLGSIQKDVNKKNKQIKEARREVYSTELNDYINPENENEWNQVYEGYFFAYHILNYEVEKLTSGASLFTKNLSDKIKRAGSTAPAIMPTIGIKYGLPRTLNYIVVDFGGGMHEQVYQNGKPYYDPELKANGQGLLNPIAAVWMQNSFGKEYGPVGSTMIKSVVHFQDFENGNVPYLKQAIRHITGQTLRLSSQDFKVFKVMNIAIWNVPYDSKRTIGQVFEDYVGRRTNENFSDIIDNVVEILENNPALKEQVAYQAVDKSAVKTGANRVFSINEINGLADGSIIESIKKSGDVTYTNENNEPCMAEGGAFDFTMGQEWEIVKDLKNYPSHKEGGVELVFTDALMKRNGISIPVAHGLLYGNKQGVVS